MKTHSSGDSQQITSVEACEILGIDRATVTRWVATGKLTPSFKFPGRTGGFLFLRGDIEALLSTEASA